MSIKVCVTPGIETFTPIAGFFGSFVGKLMVVRPYSVVVQLLLHSTVLIAKTGIGSAAKTKKIPTERLMKYLAEKVFYWMV